MKKIFILPLFAAALANAQTGNVGVNTTSPTNTLDVNGTLRVRDIPTAITSDFYTTVDANGVLQKVKPSRIVDSRVDQASGPVNVTVNANSVVWSYSDLGLQNTITVPAGKKYGITLFYSIPMGVTPPAAGIESYTVTTTNIASPASPINAFPITYTNTTYKIPANVSGYFGVGFYKNGTLLPEPTRKVTIPKRSGSETQMTTVAATYTELIDNTAGTSALSTTYTLKGYVEHYDDSTYAGNIGGTIRFNMYSTTEPNYNWGRGTLSYILFELN